MSSLQCPVRWEPFRDLEAAITHRNTIARHGAFDRATCWRAPFPSRHRRKDEVARGLAHLHEKSVTLEAPGFTKGEYKVNGAGRVFRPEHAISDKGR